MDYGYGNKWHQLGLLGLAAVLLLTFWAGLWYQSRRLEPAVLVSEVSSAAPGGEEQGRKVAVEAGGDLPSATEGPEWAAAEGVSGISQEAGPGTKPVEGMLGIHVVGQVRKPGVYYFPEGSRMEEAVAAAEPMEDADLARLNLAMPLQDGLQIRVPKLGAGDPSHQGQLVFYPEDSMQQILQNGDPLTDRRNGSRIDLNTAGQSELESLPGIGPALAERILDDRRANGPFSRLEDLDRVKGIGGSLIEGIRDRVVCGS
jgi:competence protein ComEA